MVLLMSNKIYLLFFITVQFIFSQENNSYNFQSNGDFQDFVKISSDPQNRPITGITLEAWVKPIEDPESYNMNGIVSYLTFQSETIESGFALIFKNGLWRFIVVTSNTEDVFQQVQNFPGIEVQFDGDTWTHIAGTYDGTDVKIFKNGIQQGDSFSVDGGGGIKWSNINTDMFIGKYMDLGGSSYSFKGSIDEVRLWEIAREQSEIMQTKNEELDGDEEGLIGYWNFNDNQSSTVSSKVEGGVDGELTAQGNGNWDDNFFSGCVDEEITVLDFPYSHLSNLVIEDNDWDVTSFTYNSGEIHTNGADGMDYTYKLTLSELTDIYITTCDSETNIDVQISIYTSECDTSSWILFQDDSDTDIFYPDGENEIFDFECISGFETNPKFGNMLPNLQLNTGTYYVVVDDRNGNNGTVKTYFGYSLVVDSTTASDDYSEINYHFSEGVFGGSYSDVYNGNGTALDVDDYSLTINANGGDANSANIISLSLLNGEELTPSAQDVKININYPVSPSGVEEVTLGPASVKSIFNSVGIPLLDIDGITIELVDAKAPSLTSSNPANGAINIPRDLANIELNFSETIRHIDNSNITNSNISDCFLLENLETGNPINCSIQFSDNQNFLINTAGEQLPEFSRIRFSLLTNIEDQSDNAMELYTISFRTADETPPQINSSAISSINSYVSINFNEGVFTNNNASGGLTLDDLNLNFTSNNGNCETLSIASLKNQEGSGLVGGELIVHAMLQLGGSPSGIETITFNPINNETIFDSSGNAMQQNTASELVTLLASAYIDSYVLADSNEFVSLIYSVDVYGNSSQTSAVNASAYTASINSNGGQATSVSISSITNDSGVNITGGEDTIRVFLTYNKLPSGSEKIIISPVSNLSIFSLSGIPVPLSEVSDSITLNDQNPPTSDESIDDGDDGIIENDPLIITFSESIYLESGEEATLNNLAEFITLKLGNSTGTDIPFNIFLEGEPPTLSIVPIEPYPSEAIIYYSFVVELKDQNGNNTELNKEALFKIRDYMPPTVNLYLLAQDNSYIDLTFDDNIYGADNASGTINVEDIEAEVISEGQVTSCSITSITKTDSNFLIGGETSVRVNLQYNGTPDGNEKIIIRPTEDHSVFDESANKLLQVTFTDTINLKDALPPSITTYSFPIDSFIVLMKDTPILFSFNEKIDSLEYTVKSSILDSINYQTVRGDSSLEIILIPPFASYDSIKIDFPYIQDQVGLSTVDISYTYLTPMLGDYNFDNLLTYNDVSTFVQNWESKNFNYELGPVTGEAPHFISNPDTRFDIEDGMAFTRMWSWYQKTFGVIIGDIESVGMSIQIFEDDNELKIVIEEPVLSGQLQFIYNENDMPINFISKDPKNSQLFLNSHSKNKGYSIIEFARVDNYIDTISVLHDKKKNINLVYSFFSKNFEVYQKGNIGLDYSHLPENLSLFPSYPNPFNPITNISFDIPDQNKLITTKLSIFNLKGQEVKTIINANITSGRHQMYWNAEGYPSGVYFVQLQYGDKVHNHKIILLK